MQQLENDSIKTRRELAQHESNILCATLFTLNERRKEKNFEIRIRD